MICQYGSTSAGSWTQRYHSTHYPQHTFIVIPVHFSSTSLNPTTPPSPPKWPRVLLNWPWKVSPSSQNTTTKSTIPSPTKPSKASTSSRKCATVGTVATTPTRSTMDTIATARHSGVRLSGGGEVPVTTTDLDVDPAEMMWWKRDMHIRGATIVRGR